MTYVHTDTISMKAILIPILQIAKVFTLDPRGSKDEAKKFKFDRNHRSIFNISTKLKNSCQKFYRDNAFNDVSNNASYIFHFPSSSKFSSSYF